MKRIRCYKFIFVIQTLILMVVPYLEYPDSTVYLGYLKENKDLNSFYFKFLLKIKNVLNLDFNMSEEVNINFNGYLSNDFMYNYKTYFNETVLRVQVVNILLVVFVIIVLTKIIKVNYSEKEIAILYFTFPTINYCILNITTDLPVYLYTPIFMNFILKDRLKYTLLNFIICMIIFKYGDTNIITNIIFISVLVVVKVISKYFKSKYKILLLALISLIILKILFNVFLKYMPHDIIYIYNTVQNHYINKSFLTKIIAFFLSFCFGIGSGNFRGILIIYFVNIFLIINICKRYFLDNQKKIKNIEFQLLISGLITFLSIFIIVPNYVNIKYYTYIIYIYIYILYKLLKKDDILKYYLFNTVLIFFSIIKVYLNNIK